MAVVRPSGSESNLSLTVTAAVLLSELGGQSNQNWSGGDEKMDALLGLALNLMMPYKRRVGCDPPRHPSLPLSCPCFPLFPSSYVGRLTVFGRAGRAVEGLINAIFVRTLLRWPERPVTNRIENTPFLQIGLTGRLYSCGAKRAIYRSCNVTEMQVVMVYHYSTKRQAAFTLC